MEINLQMQALGLVLAGFLGFFLGFFYDLIRPPRTVAGKVCAAVLDVLYSITAGAAVFLYAMGAPGGRLGVWELAASLLGFLLYVHLCSRFVLPVLELLLRFFGKLWQRGNDVLKKIWDLTKIFFQYVRK